MRFSIAWYNLSFFILVERTTITTIVEEYFKFDPFVLNSLKLTFQYNDNARILLIFCSKRANKKWNP